MPPSAANILRQALKKLTEATALLEQYSRTASNIMSSSQIDGPVVYPQAEIDSEPHSKINLTEPQTQCHSSQRLSNLHKHDMQAFQLWQYQGLKQVAIARTLNEEYGTTYCQGQISRMINRVQRHMKATGLYLPSHASVSRAATVDPAILDMGRRTDRRPSDGRRSKRGAGEQ